MSVAICQIIECPACRHIVAACTVEHSGDKDWIRDLGKFLRRGFIIKTQSLDKDALERFNRCPCTSPQRVEAIAAMGNSGGADAR